MRALMLTEIHQVSGANVLSDLQSLAQNGIAGPEQTLSVLCLGAGAVVGGLLHTAGTVLGFGVIVGWVGYGIYKSYNPASATNAAPANAA